MGQLLLGVSSWVLPQHCKQHKNKAKTRAVQAGRESWLPFDGEMQIKLNHKKKRQRRNTENRRQTEQDT